MPEYFDVVIVGSGAAGAVCAHFLADQGFSVCCVEKGDWADRGSFPSNTFAWESIKRSTGSFNPNLRAGPSDYEIDVFESPVDIANYNGVGGATVLFSGHYPRFHVSDFSTYSLDRVGVDWPINYFDLKAHYEANEKFLGVAGLPGDPMYPDRLTHLRSPLPLGVAGEVLAHAFNRLGWHWWPSYSAILTQAEESRGACTNDGLCNTGCHNGAKGSADVSFVKHAIGCGLVLKTNSIARRIICKNGRAVGLECLDSSGKELKLRAKKVVLAGNAIGTCRLLWSSGHGEYLGNSSGLIGKNFMIHPLGYVEGILDEANDACFGPQGSWIASHQFYETDPSTNFFRGYSMHLLKGAGPADVGFNSLMRKRATFGSKEFLSDLKRRVRNTVSVGIICEDLPEVSNRIEMLPSVAKDGLPIPKVFYKCSENTKKMMAHGTKQAKTLLSNAGASEIFGAGPIRFAGWHLTGTAKMGTDPRYSVVNRTGEMHDVKDLHIIDGSVFPTSSGVNPAATIQAVSRYMSSKIAHEL